MNQKDFTIIGTFRGISFFFDNVRDDEHACFIFETLAEFPDDQLISAIDIDGAIPKSLWFKLSFNTFMDNIQAMIKHYAEDAELNNLLYKMA